MDRPRPIRGKLTPSIVKDLVTAAIGLLTAFEVFDMTPAQVGAILAFVGVLGIVLTTYGVLSSEGEVTPVADPLLPDGSPVTLTDGTAGRVERL